MQTGIELIAQERTEQIEKHGRTIEMDVEENSFDQLSEAAICLALTPRHTIHDDDLIPEDYSPFKWDKDIFSRMMDKPYIDRLIIAGALIAAEIDRLQSTQE